MPTSSAASMASSGHKLSFRSSGSCSPSPSLCSLSPKSSLSYRSTSLSPKTSVINGYNGSGYNSFGGFYNNGNFYSNGNGFNNGHAGQNGGIQTNGNSPSSVNHNSCILVNGGQRKLSNSYLRFQRRYSKHGWDPYPHNIF